MKHKDSIIVFLAITIILSIAKLKAGFTILLIDRFCDGVGWIQVIVAAFVGVLLFHKTLHTKDYAKLRSRMWIIFCIIFFVQFIIGAFLSDKFLLTGKLHIPVPFVIIAGAIYRGEINFMVILYFVTILLTGGIWCSHLCYFGGFDLLSARCATKKRALALSYRAIWIVKLSVLILLFAGAFLMRYLENAVYLFAVIAFVIAVEIVLILLSKRHSKMIHCTLFCPIGTLTSILKVINPLRVKIDESRCTKCQKCVRECRYSAIDKESLSRAKVRLNCTQCGDCMSACDHDALHYKIGWMDKNRSKVIFKMVMVIFYMIFVSVAMV